MSTFDRALERIRENKENEHNCIPFPFERFRRFLPGVMQKKYYITTASSGIGKSQLNDELFLYNPYEFIKENETDIKLRIFYFALEEDKQTKIVKGVSRKLFRTYGVRADVNHILSIGPNRCSQELYEQVRECKDYFDDLEGVCTIYDEPINPYGIFKEVESYCLENGKVHKKRLNIKGKDYEVFDYYEPNDPNEYVIVVVDHLSLLGTESGMNLHGTISKFSSRDCVQLRNRYGVTISVVQQQMAAQEEQQFTFKGTSIASKLEPSLDGLADNKLTARDSNVVLGLFAPDRYGLKNHRGYDILKMGDHYRSLKILKNREGISNVRVGLYFDGAVNKFSELPASNEGESLRRVYEKIQRLKSS